MSAASSNSVPEGLRSLLDLCGDGACLVETRDWNIVYANSPLAQLVGLPSELPTALSVFEAVPEFATPEITALLADFAVGDHLEARIDLRGDGDASDPALAEVRIRRVEGSEGALLAMVFAVSCQALTLPPASHAGIDPLTGLADRSSILEKLRMVLRGDRLEDQQPAVLFVDVDGFKQVNDTYGHLIGDRVLVEVARRLAAAVRSADFVARFGGDEFLVLLGRIGGRGEVAPVVRRIQAAFALPIPLPQGEVTLSVSVGAARAGDDGTTPDALIDAADRAMYAAKRATA